MNKIIDDDIINIISNSFYCDDNDNKIIFLKKIGEKKISKEITVDDIYNIILEIEIQKRNLFLKNFKILFKRIDTDSDGIINSYDTSVLFGNIFDEISDENYYDTIISGDLGYIGKDIAIDIAKSRGYNIKTNYNDCGVLMFDKNSQDTHSGGSRMRLFS